MQNMQKWMAQNRIFALKNTNFSPNETSSLPRDFLHQAAQISKD